MLKPYNPAAWFWTVGSDGSQVYSSAAADFVKLNAPAYADFLDTGGHATRVASINELREVLLIQAPAGWNHSLDSPEQVKATRMAEIKAALVDLDFKSIRPLREGDAERVADLKAQAEALRKELGSL